MSSARAVEPSATLIEAVGRAFRRHGYEGTTMSVLSRETGLGRSSLYHHFPTGKAGMAHAALDRVERFLRDDLGPLLATQDEDPGRREAVARLFLDYFQGGSLGCLLGAFSLQGCPPDIVERVHAVMGLWISQFEARFRAAGASNPRLRAEQAIAVIQGSLVLAAIRCDLGLVERTLNDALPP